MSSYGWAIGYLGGGLLLALNLALFARADALGLATGLVVRINLASAGVWWALFTLIPLAALRTRGPARERTPVADDRAAEPPWRASQTRILG